MLSMPHVGAQGKRSLSLVPSLQHMKHLQLNQLSCSQHMAFKSPQPCDESQAQNINKEILIPKVRFPIDAYTREAWGTQSGGHHHSIRNPGHPTAWTLKFPQSPRLPFEVFWTSKWTRFPRPFDHVEPAVELNDSERIRRGHGPGWCIPLPAHCLEIHENFPDLRKDETETEGINM